MHSPPAAGGQVVPSGITASGGTTVTSGAGANTKGASFTTITSTTAHHADGIVVHLRHLNTAASDYVVDIALGAASSEVIIAADLLVCNGTGTNGKGCDYVLPIQVPKGSRISAKIASTGVSLTLQVAVTLLSALPGYVESFQKVTTYGARLTGGVQIDPGATVNTKGAWAAVGTVTQPVEGIVLGFGNRASSVKQTAGFLVDVQASYAGGSATLIPDFQLETVTSDDTVYPGASPFLPFHCPAGGTINARALCGSTVSPGREFDIVAYAVN